MKVFTECFRESNMLTAGKSYLFFNLSNVNIPSAFPSCKASNLISELHMLLDIKSFKTELFLFWFLNRKTLKNYEKHLKEIHNI